MALVRSIATVGGYTGISRITGFLRDILIASAIGASPVADAFFVAFRFPNFFRRIFGEGAFNAAFVPLFARRLESEAAKAAGAGGDSREEARRFAEDTLAVMLLVLLPLSALIMAAMPWLMYVIAPGFVDEPAKFDLTVDLTRITFPYLLFMSLFALLGGVLNSIYRFTAMAAAPILLNVFFIFTLLALVPFFDRPGHLLAWTVAAAGAAQFLMLALACARAGMPLSLPRPRLNDGTRRLFKLMVPGVLSAGALQVNLVVGTIIASMQAGAVSYLYYADRVYQLPLGLIGIAFGIVLLPDLSRKLRAGEDAAARDSLNRGLELAMLLTLPATAALIVIPWEIIVVLFERGAFAAEASEATAA
ncbi:MAG: murein biosynthesis integral membrane protein MurJ, partial [Rhodovibrionaceae bacterium]|nr:murein biosynthesis integral membrane protein MurJ [Rhodovibrionaceae bacterium]